MAAARGRPGPAPAAGPSWGRQATRGGSAKEGSGPGVPRGLPFSALLSLVVFKDVLHTWRICWELLMQCKKREFPDNKDASYFLLLLILYKIQVEQ